MPYASGGKNREGVQDQLRTIIRRAAAVAEGLDRERLNRTPEGGGWSIGECIEHLNETARLYLPALAECIDDARDAGRLADAGSASRTLLGRIVAWSQEPPVRFRMKTFDAIRPSGDLDPDEVLEDFEALHEELIVRINEAADLDWRGIKLRSLLDRRIKLSLGDWFHFLAAHCRRHLWQAEQVKERIGESHPHG